MRRNHDAPDLEPRTRLETADALQCTAQQRRTLGVRARLRQFVAPVVVAVDQQRQSTPMGPKQRSAAGVGVPGVERDRRESDVVILALRPLGDGAVVGEAVGGPVQVRVVDHEGRARRWQRLAERTGRLARELEQRKHLQEALACCRRVDVAVGRKRRQGQRPAMTALMSVAFERPDGLSVQRAGEDRFVRRAGGVRGQAQLRVHDAIAVRPRHRGVVGEPDRRRLRGRGLLD